MNALVVSDIIFWALSITVILAAIAALESKSLVYAATSLMIMSLGLAGLYYLLNAAYITAFQIAVYVGAVVSLVLFTVMLFRPEKPYIKPGNEAAGILSLLLLLIIFSSTLFSSLPYIPVKGMEITISEWGRRVASELFGRYQMPFIVMALTLAASLIGAVTLAKSEPGEGEL